MGETGMLASVPATEVFLEGRTGLASFWSGLGNVELAKEDERVDGGPGEIEMQRLASAIFESFLW